MSKNRYTRALKHLKNKTIDEKLELLTELPTNHTTGLYVDVPGGEVIPPPVPGPIDSPADYSQDGDGAEGYEGKDTTGLFMEDGTIRTVEPPGDTSYILGPMASMWYAWANYTQIGYIRQEDRKMVNLGRITGQLDDWDGVSGFTGYGQMTIEQAVWFKDITRVNDYRAFYPGPPSSVADEYGRYICSITGESKATTRQPPANFVPGTQQGGNPSDNFALMMDLVGELGELVYRDPKALQDYINNLTPEQADSQLFDNNISLFGDTIAAAASAEYNIGRQTAKALTNVAGGTVYNPSLRAVGSQGRGLGGEVRIGQHGTGPQAARGIKKDGFRAGSRQNVYGTQSVFLDPSMSGRAADEFARAGAAAEAGGRGTAGRSAGQRAADLRAAGTEAGEKIPVAYKPGTGSRMNVPGTKYAEVGVDAKRATRGARLAQNAATKYPNSAKAAQLVRTGATTAKVTGARAVAKTLGKAVPFAGAAISVADAGVRFSQGDIAGGIMSGLTAVPGPVGWTALGAQIVYDTARANPTSSIRGRSGAKRASLTTEEKEYDSYQDYVDRAKETIDKKNIKLDKGLLDVLKTELGLSDKLSDEDKEYLVDLFDDPKNIDPEEATAFVKKIVKKLGSDIKENVQANFLIRKRILREQAASGGGTITAHTEAGDVTINLPSTPPMPPEDDGGMTTTPQGVDPLTDYSKNTFNWLKGQESEYFVSGYIQSTASRPGELEKMFAGTNIKWYQVDSMVSEIKETERARDEAQKRSSEIWDEIYPQLNSLSDQINDLLAIPEWTWTIFYKQYMPLENEINRLWAMYDESREVTWKLTQESLTLSGQLGRYVQSGTIVDMDPFKLNDPTIKKEKELDEQELNKLIAELKKAASDAKRSAALNKLKAFGYGALLAAAAVVGFKLLTGAAAVKTLGAPVVGTLKKLAPQVTKTVTKTPISKDPTLPTKVANAVDDALSNLMKNVHNDATSKNIFNQLTRAQQSGSTSAAERALNSFAKYKGSSGTKGLFNSHQPSGKLLTESQKRVLRNVKKPVKVREIPTKVKVKPTGRKNKNVGSSMMKNVETPVTYKPITNIWSKKDKMQNIRASQEKKNQVLELVGAAEHHWTYLTEDRRKKKQEKVNEMLSLEYDKALELLYENYKKSIDGKAEKLVNKIRSKIQPEYPKTPPPELDPETGMHPKYGKKYKHDKLDPHSAESMPPTGDPVIDANAKKAHDPVQKARKLKILRGKNTKEETNWSKVSKKLQGLNEGMTTASLGMINLNGEGDIDLSTSDVGSSASYSQSSNAQFSGSQATYNFSGSASVGETYSRSGYFDPIDATRFDSFVTRVTVGSGPSLWNEPREGTPTHAFPGGFRVVMYPKSIEGNYNDYHSQELTTGTNTITIPSSMRSSDLVVYYIGWANKDPLNGGVTGDHIVHSATFQRKNPINLFVSLDDPEALSFMRGGLGGDEERRKKLKDMLDSGNELMIKLGINPSKTSPGDIELADMPYVRDGRRHSPGSTTPSGAARDSKNMKWDPHMKTWAPNIPKA